GSLLDVEVRVSSDLAADRHVPGQIELKEAVVYARTGPMEAGCAAGPAVWMEAVFATSPGHVTGTGDGFALRHDQPHYTLFVDRPTPVLDLSPPGGIITFVYQQNIAEDRDILLVRPLDLDPQILTSRADATLDAEFTALAGRADALTLADFILARSSPDIATRIETLQDSAAGFDPHSAPEGASVTLVSQQDGTLPESGILVDGAPADSLPDTLEAALAARGFGPASVGDDEPSAAPDHADGVVTGSIEVGPDGAAPEADPMQTIDTGGNILVNTAVSGLAPVDAPVIAVAGSAVSFTVVSQVNVMADRDMVLGSGAALCSGSQHPFAPEISEGHNVASVHWEGATWTSAGDGDGAPLGFAITEIDGDLVLTTHVVQLNLIADGDVVSFVTAFHTVEIGTGGNLSTDALNQLGFQTGFDMILVGGDMLSLVSVAQLNLLFDNDLVADGDGVGGAADTAGNLLWNETQITWHGVDTGVDGMSEACGTALATMAGGGLDLEALKSEALLAGKDVPLLLTVSGDLVFDYRLEQINILADADTVQLFADAALDHGMSPVEVATGGNILANLASLDIYGTDSTVMASGGVYSDLVIHQAGMYDTDAAPLEQASSGPALASEAVVFLAEGMIEDISSGDPGGGEVIVATGGGSDTFDTLGGVVA
ncbi:MAG: hypothetical protein R3D80_21910, partial [Paracoccaceae bacterium]